MFLGLGLTAWTAILAAATVAAIAAAVWLATSERRRDDRKRAEDRERDERRRAEDRERDDRLRAEGREDAERREQAERIARQDYEARQVLVTVEHKEHPGNGHTFNRRITLSAPHAYPIKQVEGCMVLSDLAIIGFGHVGDEPSLDEQHTYYLFWVN
jgi:hypothetical protein